MTTSSADRTVIVGAGNTLMQDEGVGVHVVRHIQQTNPDAPFEIVEASTMVAQCVGDLASIRRLVVVDAVDADGPAGALYRIPASRIPTTQAGISIHDLTLADALATWQLQGLDLDRVTVMGIQPAETGFGEGLSEPVKDRLPQICRAVVREASFHAQPTRKGR